MLRFVTGNILESDSQCLVNTVNCEGYMGKGIAYQFKLNFPENNKDYVKTCNSGDLAIGKIHHFKEKDKWIFNFPTKDEWRRKSKIEYIEAGLPRLIELVHSLDIKSISIPPLGCGNGGLKWVEVRDVIIAHLKPISNSVYIYIYEPSHSYKAKPVEVPKINFSHLVLMRIKLDLEKFNKLRLQKSAFYVNLFLGSKYFKFEKHKYGPYAHSIDILSKNIKEFQDYYNVDTEKAIEIALTIATSEAVDRRMHDFECSIKKSTSFVNKIKNDLELEFLSTICSILEDRDNLSVDDIYEAICSWSHEKAMKFTRKNVLEGIDFLIENDLVGKNLIGLYLDPR